MEDLNINVAKGFGLRWKYITKEKASYLCHTDSGIKVIKKTTSAHRHIVFQHQLKTRLYDRGFRNIDIYGLSVQGLPYFECGGETYVLTDKTGGKPPDFQNNADFNAVIEAAAMLHKAGRGFSPPDAASFSQNGNIKDVFSRRIQELAAVKKKLKRKSSLSDFDVIFIKNYDYYYAQMREAFDELPSAACGIGGVCAAERSSICHNLLKEENLSVAADGTNTASGADVVDIYITNFSECSFDSCVFDLADIIRRYMKNLPEDYIPVSDILRTYTRLNPLDAGELAMLRPLIIFPGKFVKICMQHYVKNRSFVPSALNARMKNLIDRQALTDEYLKTFQK